MQVTTILTEPPAGDGLDNPVHLDQVAGTVDLREGQPVQLVRGAEPGGGRQELSHAGRFVENGLLLDQQLSRDWLREKNADRLNR